MARTSTYLNFERNTEEAFLFYQTVFGGEFHEPGIVRMGSGPGPEAGGPELSEADKQLVMHIELSITGGHVLMGTDAPESMGFSLNKGNNVHLNLEPDTLAEAERLFNALSTGGTVSMPLMKMFWGAHFASWTDKFGVQWMLNCVGE